jgi:hypothetical protein
METDLRVWKRHEVQREVQEVQKSEQGVGMRFLRLDESHDGAPPLQTYEKPVEKQPPAKARKKLPAQTLIPTQKLRKGRSRSDPEGSILRAGNDQQQLSGFRADGQDGTHVVRFINMYERCDDVLVPKPIGGTAIARCRDLCEPPHLSQERIQT